MPSSKSSVDNRDVYYRLGKSAGYRARSAYKLLHLDEEFGLFRGVNTAVDLCAAPGSWTQVLGQAIKPGKGEHDPKVVSVDLQPMAPLPNTTILQTDITLPSTIPLVLNALGGRKADLVVCDGAPDVTGVHDLDAYLHSQLLLAAITLSLTLLAPHATLIFKIFLSPLDPQAAILRSQLECFFPGGNSGPAYSEFDDFEDDMGGNVEGIASVQISHADETPSDDLSKGGVWVRKPRSSRKGSGEAFIVCRNFDPAKVPLPITFSPEALRDLEQQSTGTLTLESLAHLGSAPMDLSPEWEAIKAYVGSGDLDIAAAHSSHSKSLSPELGRLSLQLSPSHSLSRDSSIRSIRDLHAHPTPRDELDEYFTTAYGYGDSLSPTKVGLGIKRNGSARRPRVSSIASNASTGTSPGGTSFFASLATQERLFDHRLPGIPTPRRYDSGDSKDWDLAGTPPRTDGQPSPALSTASKTDAFFSTSPTESNLPIPPKPIGRVSSIGHGWPSSHRGHDRAISMPALQAERPERHTGSPSLDVYPRHRQTSHLFEPENPIRITSETFTEPPLPSLPTLTDIAGVAGGSEPPAPSIPLKRPLRQHARRESQQFIREQREAPVDSVPFQKGDVLVPFKGDRQWPVEANPRQWVLGKRLGEGAFSAVWEADELSPPEGAAPKLAAVKVTSRAVCQANSRTRIAFLREVSVLRHLSHPNIVAFLQSFSTSTHHCLVLERVTGGELFELLADESNRKRLLLPGPDDPAGEGLVRRIFSEIVRAVGWLHEVNVVHRDIKLENTMFTANPFALTPTSTGSVPLEQLPSPLIKITDFGLSRFIDPTSPMLQTRCGSESYAAPEIIMGRKYDGRSTDAWAIGVLVYALVAGELPFEGRDEGRGERSERKRRMMRIAKGQYTWPPGTGHEAVRKLVSRLLVRDPAQRASVSDLWGDEWMRGPGQVEQPAESSGHVLVGKTKCKRVLDGFLLDEEVEAEALAEEA